VIVVYMPINKLRCLAGRILRKSVLMVPSVGLSQMETERVRLLLNIYIRVSRGKSSFIFIRGQRGPGRVMGLAGCHRSKKIGNYCFVLSQISTEVGGHLQV